MALVIKTLQHKNLINKIFDRTEVLQRENNLNSDLAAILVTELLWGKKGLQGDSKPVQTILKYQEVLVESLNSEGFEETKNLTQTSLFNEIVIKQYSVVYQQLRILYIFSLETKICSGKYT